MDSPLQKQCPKCKAAAKEEAEPRPYDGREVSETAYFCSNCGQSLKSRPEDTSIPKQIVIYFVSFVLAPFGLVYAFRYLNQPDKKSKIIGAISLVLTILAIIAVIFTGKAYLEKQYSYINVVF